MTTILSPNSEKAVVLSSQPVNGVPRFSVAFGRVEGSEFFVRPFKCCRSFKTKAGAMKAVQGWFSEKTWSEE